jgi:hypothetical protein
LGNRLPSDEQPTVGYAGAAVSSCQYAADSWRQAPTDLVEQAFELPVVGRLLDGLARGVDASQAVEIPP